MKICIIQSVVLSLGDQ